ncbi:hypothetical protein KIW84_013485 [Lathyrus oleraceus]|uniref:Retrotransposon gag domain-containing protein n=1 Tax=Pisum sativum TaxID=3888 RepID=A0A9D5GY44_PEA|nr:hypothetical protein KIW84_013485 [Pisum sativum]
MKQEKDRWEERFRALSKKHEELQLESKDKDALIELLEDPVTKRQREPEVSSSSIPQPSVAWKKINHGTFGAREQRTEGQAAQSQASPTPANSPQRTVISEVATSTMSAAAHFAPATSAGFPWGMPPNFMPEGFAPTFASMTASSPVMSVPPPVVHTSCPDVYEKMDEMKDQFLEMRKELRTLRGKDLFGKSVTELCLVPNVKILVKFKVHDFEKYKGNTCPLGHLMMYARKMSTQTDNDQLLIHYFQDNLTGVALRWYMGLDSASIRTFNNLREAFVKQYKYNVDMSPDRDQLSAPSDLTKMVNMGMRLEEGVQEGRLSRDEASSSKRYDSSFGKKKDNEANAVISGRQRRTQIRRSQPSRAPRHDIENSYPLIYEVQKLTKSGMVSFEDQAPNVKANPFPAHGNSSVNMVDGCLGEFKVFDVRFIPRGCEVVKRDIQRLMDEGMIQIVQSRHVDDDVNVIVLIFKKPERLVIQYDNNNSHNVSNRSVSSLVIRLACPVPYSSDKVVPYQYNATMIKDGQEVTLPTTSSAVSIADVTKVTGSGRVFRSVFPKDKEVSVVGKKVEVLVVDPVSASKGKSGESSDLKANDNDEVLRLIKRSELNKLEQLLQTPSKILVLSLLMNSEAHREALQRVLEQAFVEHDIIVDQFDHILANNTSCNNLSFCDEELPEEGRNHNLALHISQNCKEDALSNVLLDTGFSLNVLPKSTLSKLSYQGVPMRYSGVIVKSFDGSCKTVIGEVYLLVKRGLSDFQITFQVMDIHPTYTCLLGRPWIHEAGDVTSTLHQKLKFVKSGKLVIVGGEKALLVIHLSSFSYVEAEDEDAKKIVEERNIDQWGRIVEVSNNKGRTGLGSQRGSSTARSEDMQLSFHSGWFIHGNEQHLVVVLEDDEEKNYTNFVTYGMACNNWTTVDIPVILHQSKLVPNPIEYNDPSPSPNFELPVFEAEEESDEEVSDELSRLLEQDEKTIQLFEEQIELVNLGSEDDVKEVKIGSRLCPDVKKGLIDLPREYLDVFAWSYQDMPGLDSEIVEHRLPLKPECLPVKQKLRRMHPDMAVKIKEEV